MQLQTFSFQNTSTFFFDDGHGDYNRSYEQYERDIDYADYSTDHRDNNFLNIEKKIKRSKEEILRDAWKKFND